MTMMNLVKTPLLNITRAASTGGLRRCLNLQLLGFTFLLFLTLVFFVSSAIAQAPLDANAEFFIKAPKDQPLTVGDRVTLRLEVTHPLDSRVVLPQVPEQWGQFEVVEQTDPEIIDNNDGTATTGKDIVVRLFEPGQYQTPSLVLTHRQADGGLEELGTPVIQLTITSVLTEDTELRDLKPPAELPLPPIWPWVVAGLLLGILGLGMLAGLALWLYDRRRKRTGLALAPAPFMDTRPPEVIALTELDRIEALNLPAHNQIKEHYSLIDICLRRYIEGRYEVPALEQTRDELRLAFRRSAALAEDAAEFMDILVESDLVKFARYVPHVDNVRGLVNRARNIVHVTTPKALETPEAPVGTEPEVMP
jgi:hypothetical protein